MHTQAEAWSARKERVWKYSWSIGLQNSSYMQDCVAFDLISGTTMCILDDVVEIGASGLASASGNCVVVCFMLFNLLFRWIDLFGGKKFQRSIRSLPLLWQNHRVCHFLASPNPLTSSEKELACKYSAHDRRYTNFTFCQRAFVCVRVCRWEAQKTWGIPNWRE